MVAGNEVRIHVENDDDLIRGASAYLPPHALFERPMP